MYIYINNKNKLYMFYPPFNTCLHPWKFKMEQNNYII